MEHRFAAFLPSVACIVGAVVVALVCGGNMDLAGGLVGVGILLHPVVLGVIREMYSS